MLNKLAVNRNIFVNRLDYNQFKASSIQNTRNTNSNNTIQHGAEQHRECHTPQSRSPCPNTLSHKLRHRREPSSQRNICLPL